MPVLLAIGPQPPPIHGAALVNASVCGQLAHGHYLHIVDTSVQAKVVPLYHLRRILRHLWALVTIVRHSITDGPRHLYITSPAGRALFYMLPLIMVARLLGYYVVVHHHSYAYVSRFSLVMQALVRLVGDSGRHVLLCPDMGRRFDRAYRPRRRSTVCSNAAWTDAGSGGGSRELPSRTLRVGHLGSLTVAKGLTEVTRLTLALIAEGIQAELWLAGGTPTKRDRVRLDSVLQELGPSRGRCLGTLDGSAKAQFFADIDVFVLPTRYRHEAQPLVVFEALQAGVPVVSYGIGCIPSQLRTSGLLVSPRASFVDEALPFLRRLQDADVLPAARRSAREAFEIARSDAAYQARSLIEELAVR